MLDAQAPVKTKTIITKHAPWIKDEVLDHIKERNRLRKESMEKTVEAWNAYKKQRNLTTKIIRKAKRDRISDIVTKGKSEDMWDQAKKYLGWPKQGPPTGIVKDGVFLTKQEPVANGMNEILTEKINNVKSKINHSQIDPLENTRKFLEGKRVGTFKLGRVTNSQVFNAIKKLNNTSASGHDNIPSIAGYSLKRGHHTGSK